MGNAQFKCPTETVYGAAPLSCVMACPDTYELRMVDGAQRCVNKVDPDATIHLVPQAAVMRGLDNHSLFSISELKDSNPDAYTRYTAEQERFKEDKEKADAQVSHKAKVDAAARDVLAANGADEAANARYSALTDDPNALDVMYANQIKKDTDRFISEYQFLNNQVLQQQQTLDLVNGVKDNIGTVKDDLEYSVGTFSKQISDIRNQININRRTHDQALDYGKWLGIGLNVLIVLALLYLLFTVGRRAMNGATLPSNPASPPNTGNGADFMGAFAKYITESASKPAV
jgi:hypothetical protein